MQPKRYWRVEMGLIPCQYLAQTWYLQVTYGSQNPQAPTRLVQFELRMPPACIRLVWLDIGMRYVSHLCHLSSGLFCTFQNLLREHSHILPFLLSITPHSLHISPFVRVSLEWNDTGWNTWQCELGISCETKTITTCSQCASPRMKIGGYTKVLNMFKIFVPACRGYMHQKNTVRIDCHCHC